MNTVQKYEENHGGHVLGATLERRETSRFPVREEVRYRVLQSKAVQLTGAGHTLDISSGGIRFTTQEELTPGRVVELAVNWPARLDGTCLLQLVAAGHIVRS